jgi:hypothetical protein
MGELYNLPWSKQPPGVFLQLLYCEYREGFAEREICWLPLVDVETEQQIGMVSPGLSADCVTPTLKLPIGFSMQYGVIAAQCPPGSCE